MLSMFVFLTPNSSVLASFQVKLKIFKKKSKQEALQERKPPPSLVWSAGNSLLKRETV